MMQILLLLPDIRGSISKLRSCYRWVKLCSSMLEVADGLKAPLAILWVDLVDIMVVNQAIEIDLVEVEAVVDYQKLRSEMERFSWLHMEVVEGGIRHIVRHGEDKEVG